MGEDKEFVIVRACVGCILPSTAKLIGHGDITVDVTGIYSVPQKIQFYDYEILNEEIDRFMKNNEDVLRESKLIQ